MNIASGLCGPLVAKAQTILMLVTDGFTNITVRQSNTNPDFISLKISTRIFLDVVIFFQPL